MKYLETKGHLSVWDPLRYDARIRNYFLSFGLLATTASCLGFYAGGFFAVLAWFLMLGVGLSFTALFAVSYFAMLLVSKVSHLYVPPHRMSH